MAQEFYTENIGADQSSTASTTVVSDYSDTGFQKSIKAFFKGYDGAKLSKIENAGEGHEIFDIDITLELSGEDLHAQDTRSQAMALSAELKQDFYKYLIDEHYNIATMSVRGVRSIDKKAEMTISLTLSSVPMMRHNESKDQRIEGLLTETIAEIIEEGTVKKNKAITEDYTSEKTITFTNHELIELDYALRTVMDHIEKTFDKSRIESMIPTYQKMLNKVKV